MWVITIERPHLLLPETVARNCCQKQLPETVARNLYIIFNWRIYSTAKCLLLSYCYEIISIMLIKTPMTNI